MGISTVQSRPSSNATRGRGCIGPFIMGGLIPTVYKHTPTKGEKKNKKMVKQRSGAQNENGKKIELKFYPAKFWETTCYFFFIVAMQHLRTAARQKKSKLEKLHWRLHLFLRCTIGPSGTHRFDLPFLPRRLGCQLWNLTPKTFLCSWPQRRSRLISSHDVSTLGWCSCHDNCDNRWGEK